MSQQPTSGKDGSSPSSSTKPVLITESPAPEEKPATSKTNTWPESKPRGSGRPNEFRPLVFLYRMLVGIFIVQALFLGFSFKSCSEMAKLKPGVSITEVCPRLGERAENLFGIAVATTLSLLTGQAVENFRNKD